MTRRVIIEIDRPLSPEDESTVARAIIGGAGTITGALSREPIDRVFPIILKATDGKVLGRVSQMEMCNVETFGVPKSEPEGPTLVPGAEVPPEAPFVPGVDDSAGMYETPSEAAPESAEPVEKTAVSNELPARPPEVRVNPRDLPYSLQRHAVKTFGWPSDATVTLDAEGLEFKLTDGKHTAHGYLKVNEEGQVSAVIPICNAFGEVSLSPFVAWPWGHGRDLDSLIKLLGDVSSYDARQLQELELSICRKSEHHVSRSARLEHLISEIATMIAEMAGRKSQ